MRTSYVSLLAAAVLSALSGAAAASLPGEIRMVCRNFEPTPEDEQCTMPGGTPKAPEGGGANAPFMGDSRSASQAGWGIDYTRGILSRSFTDFALPVKFGMSLDVTRSYSSGYVSSANYAGDTMFGRQWHSPYEAHLYIDDTEEAEYIFVDERGNPWHFETFVTDRFQSRLDQGKPHELIVTEDEYENPLYLVIRPDRSQLTFDENGKLLSIEADITNGIDDTITLDYDGYGRLIEVHAPSGDDRYLEFKYTSTDPKVTSVYLRSDGEPTGGYPLVFYYYHGAPETLALVRWNDASDPFTLLYEYGSFDGSTLENDDDLPTLARLSYAIGASGWLPLGGIQWQDGPGEGDGDYVWPIVDWVYELDTPGWQERVTVSDPVDGTMQVAFGAGGGTDPTMTVITTYQRNAHTVTYNAYTAEHHNTYAYQASGSGLGSPRIFGSSRLGDDISDDPIHIMTYNLGDSTFLDKYSVLSETKYGGSGGGTPMTSLFAYDATFTHKLEGVTGPSGETAEYTYYSTANAKNGQLATSFDGMRTVSYDYGTTTGLMISMTTPDGTTTFEHNARGEVEEITYPNGMVVEREYNNFGQLLSETRTNLGITTYTYSDDPGSFTGEDYLPPRLINVEDDEENTTHYYYDATGQISNIVDPNSKETMRTYDALRRLVSVENPAEEVVTYGHDEFGRMTSFTDGRAKEWTYTYDEFGRRVRETDPDSNYTELTYGTGFSGGCGCGGSSTNVAQIRRQDASIVSFEYDLAGRLLLVDYNSIGGGGSDEITYAYDLSSRVTSVVDTRLNLGDETYAFTYDEADVSHTRQSLVKVRHPEGYTQEFFYDADGHLEAYKDVDGNISENTYDAYGRLDTLTDAYGDVTSWAYAVPADTTYPVGAVKLQTYGNDAKNAYTYGDLGRLERIDHKNSSNSVMDYIELAYDPAGLITSKARSVSGGYTTHYAYDDAYRLIEEDNKNGSSVSKSKRSYEYDAAGNRISMTQWNDASVNDTTEYTYGNREQILDAEPYNYDGTTSSGDNDYTFDSRGNMTSRAWEPGGTGHLTEYDWNEDNRLIEVTEWTDQEPPEDDIGESLGFHYDYQGRRLLKRGPWVTLEIGPTIERERYFFHGLTEDIKKVSVDGAHADSAFEFATKEDGISASEWKATNASVTSTNSTSRRSDVIALDGVAPPVKMSFMIGDTSGTGSNPNDVAWDSTKRTLSFWQQGGFSKLQVLLTSSAGEKKVTYNTGTGINGHTGNNVEIYLGTTGSTSWQRFERNIEADYETYAGGATWTNTDGLNILPDATYGSYDMNIDDIRLSNSLTSEHNTLGPGSIAHILRHRKIDPTTHAVTDRWFHYDQVGSVMNESNVAGTLEATHHQDAFGNVEVAWDSGVWDAGVSGWHHNTKEIDGAARLTYMYQRWYVDHLGSFHSRAPLPPIEEAPFGFAGGNPVMAIDPDGRVWWWILLLLGGAAGATGCGGSGPPPEPPDPCHWKFNGQTFDVPDEVMSSDGCKKYALEVEKGAPRTFNQNLYDAAELNCLKCAYNRAVARDEAEDRKD